MHPLRLKRIDADGWVNDAFDAEGMYPKRRQELELLYVRNGGIYLAKVEVIDAGGLWGSKCLAYVMSEERSVNINTDFDLRIAELLILARPR
jgi:CMP-N-acetylneuraminic acid synthetase